MASSLYDGLDDVELSKGNSAGGGSSSSGGSGWVLGGTTGTSSGSTSTTTTTGIGRLVAAASGNTTAPGGYSGMQLMQSHMAAKRAQGRRGGGSSSDFASRSAVAPVVDLHRRGAGGSGGGTNAEGSYRFNQMTGKMERVPSASSSSSSSTSRATGGSSHFTSSVTSGLLYGEPSLSLGVADEYNPLCPNDYEELSRQKREKRKADDRIRDSHGGDGFSRRPNLSGSDSGGSSDNSGDDRDDRGRRVRSHHRRRPPPPPPASRAAIAPPSSLLEDVVVTPGSDSTTTATGNTTAAVDADTDELGDSIAQAASGNYGINVVAAKMMARMGYRQGQGLGKEGQGMSSALVVEKTSRRGGKIIHEKDLQRTQEAEMALAAGGVGAEQQMPTAPLNATEVVLLQNMCGGPNEVDDDLEPETAEECAKYGSVVTCMIYQMPDAGDGPEAVRIFVEFENTEAAARAVYNLNGRFFDGRVVQAGFYDAERFRSLEFSDPPLS